MKKSRTTHKQKGEAERESPQSGGAITPVGVHLETVALRSLEYRELGAPQATSEPAAADRMALGLQLRGEIRMHAQPSGQLPILEFGVNAEIRPERAVKPIEIKVSLTAIVAGLGTTDFPQLLEFINHAGLRLVFPYLREIVSSITGRGVYGPLFLDPIATGPMLPPEAVAEMLSRHASAQSGPPQVR